MPPLRVALVAAVLSLAAGCGPAAPAAAPTGPVPHAASLPVPSAAPTLASARPSRHVRPPRAPSSAATSAAARPALAGEVVVLDPGHNGGGAAHPEIINRLVYAGNGIRKACNTTGTATDAGYPEHAFTWDVSVRTAAILRAAGAHVVLTRPSDSGVGPCVDVRPAIANAHRAAAFVSIHADGNLAVGARGFHVIEPVAAVVGARVAGRSDTLARDLRALFRADTGIPYANYLAGGDGLDRRSDLGTLNLSTRPVAMIECGNLRDATDAAILASADGRARIAAAIAAGIERYLGH